MMLRDLCRIKNAMEGQLSPEQIRAMRKYESSDFPVFQFHNGSLDTPVPDAGNFLWHDLPLMIDLRYPNSVLIEHFKAYLQMLRKDPRGKPEEAAKHSPDLTKWASQGLLACMDLILWAEEKGCRISDSRLVKALNPDPYDDISEDGGVDEESVRKTIRPLAKELLDWRTYPHVDIDRLRAIASLDLTKKYGLES
jgi:hypothetical protein